MVRFCLTLSLIIPSAVFAEDTTPWGDWFNPPRSIGPTLDYSTNPVYVIGDTTQLDWTTVYRNYSIALWQQNPGGGWATLGPVIYRTQCTPNPESLTAEAHRLNIFRDIRTVEPHIQLVGLAASVQSFGLQHLLPLAVPGSLHTAGIRRTEGPACDIDTLLQYHPSQETSRHGYYHKHDGEATHLHISRICP